jgi:hypothetical protein
MIEQMTEPEDEQAPTYGLLAITLAYNEGNITFKEWLELSREWAEKLIGQQREGTQCPSPVAFKPFEAATEAG